MSSQQSIIQLDSLNIHRLLLLFYQKWWDFSSYIVFRSMIIRNYVQPKYYINVFEFYLVAFKLKDFYTGTNFSCELFCMPFTIKWLSLLLIFKTSILFVWFYLKRAFSKTHFRIDHTINLNLSWSIDAKYIFVQTEMFRTLVNSIRLALN